MATNIEWTQITDNIIKALGGGWWCRKCSEGCLNCYAEGINDSAYFKGNHLPYTGAAPQMILRRDILAGWARQRNPKRHFVASMTDVFGEWVPKEWCFEFLDAMTAAPIQTFQVLTKRARRMAEIVKEWLELRGLEMVPVNIHLGTSVENQQWADVRIPHLLSIPCHVRFLNCEPLLGPVCLDKTGAILCDPAYLEKIAWVIVGGESGPKARAMHPDWARALRDQCVSADVPFLFKQWGNWIEVPAFQKEGDMGMVDTEGLQRSCVLRRVPKKKAGRVIDGRTWDEFPREVQCPR